MLGCSGAEFPGHHLSGFLVDGRVLFDAGTLNQVLDLKRQLKIETIFVTHSHMDHIREIPFLADNIIIGGWRRRVNIFSIRPVIQAIKDHLLNFKLWPDMTVLPNAHDAVIRLSAVKEGRPHVINGFVVTPYKVNHSVPAVGYLVEDRRGRRFFYTGDTGPTDSTWQKVGGRNIHALIVETSFPNRMEAVARMMGHLTPALLGEELRKIEKLPERIYITHMKPQFYKTIQKELTRLNLKNLHLLEEGEILEV